MSTQNKITAALTALVMIFGTSAAPCIKAAADTDSISAVQENGAVHISTAEDLIRFSSECTYDKNSKGKKYILDCDITVNEEFLPIPTFSGEFDGNGHSISGFTVSEGGSMLGLFLCIEERGTVKNLRVNGRIYTDGTAEQCGGIAAVNRGKIINCSFSGIIKGTEILGGIAGTNEETGLISACSAEGAIHGNKSAGGIAGINNGTVISCENLSLVNTDVNDESFSITDISLDDLGLSDRSADIADIGGIVGSSVGTVQNCTNKGNVGYAHVGYNIGGIAGRQSGYVTGCVNYGEINGRKDTGGIVGQAEPYTAVFFSESKLDTLRTQLNTLSDSLADAVDHAESRSDTATDDMDSVIGKLDALKSSADSFLDEADRIINYDVDSINEISSRISDISGMLSPAADNFADAADSLDSSMDYITEAVDCLKDSMDSADLAFDELAFVTEDLNDAVNSFRNASDSLESSLDSLKKALGDPDAMDRAMKGLSQSLDDMGKALKELSYSSDDAVTSAVSFFDRASEQIAQYKPRVINALQTIAQNAGNIGSDFTNLSNAVSGISSSISNGSGDYSQYIGDLNNSMQNIASGASAKVFAAFGELSYALYGILSEGARQDYSSYSSDGSFVNALESVGQRLHNMGNASEGLFGSLSDITGEPDIPSFDDMIEYLKQANSSVDEAADYIQNVIDAFDAANGYFDDSFVSAVAAITAISNASDGISSASEKFSEGMSQTADTLDYFSSLDEVDFIGADDKLTDCGDLMGDNIADLLDILKDVSDNTDMTSDVLADDLRKINNEARDAYNTILDMADDLSSTSTDIEDYTEDISAEDTKGFSNGKTASCTNYGNVNADVNAGGITGTMGVDLEFDPESDIITHGERNIDFIMKSKTVTRECINYGNITSKKDGAGGIAGSMETGCLINCTSYGFIESTDGNYVGGAAGRSDSAVHNCRVMAHISGGDYVGGICGQGKDIADCIGYVIIDESRDNSGMIAGFADMYSEDSVITGNVFVDIDAAKGGRSKGAVNGTSYENRAYPVTYEQLIEEYTLPAAFTDLKLTFTADGKTVDTVYFDFGDSLTEDKIPDIPYKDGCYALWEDFDRTSLVFSEEIKADYHKYITSLPSAEVRENDRPVFLIEGKFGISDKIYAAAKEGSSDSCTSWTLTVPDSISGKNESGYTVRYRPAEGTENTLLNITADGVPYGEEVKADGSYFVFRISGSEITVEEVKDSRTLVMTIAICAAAAVLILIIVLAAAKKKRKKNKKASK